MITAITVITWLVILLGLSQMFDDPNDDASNDNNDNNKTPSQSNN